MTISIRRWWRRAGVWAGLLALVSLSLSAPLVRSDDTPADPKKVAQAEKKAEPAATAEGAAPTQSTGSASSASTPAARPKHPPYADVLRDFKPVDGLIKLHRKDNQLYAEIGPHQLNRDFIVLISISRGIGEGMVLAGMSWGFGDDWLWQFRKVDESIQIVRRNVRFRAAKGSPEEKAVRLAYTDSVLFSLPILTTSPSGAAVVDLNQVFMSDLPQIARMLP
ncbi:MAG TPA: DUF5118 domain-containing protein, partial [Pirellulales bacterium]|nr:DUF5118 domain-containing protein [Pirellulales bacterium]